MDDEPMGLVRWDYEPEAWPGIRIRGSYETRKLSEAQSIARKMNEEYGEGTHWVEAQNETYAERYT